MVFLLSFLQLKQGLPGCNSFSPFLRIDTTLDTFQPSGMSSDFNEKNDRFCANSSTSPLSHAFWSCVWCQWPTENWWSYPGAFACVSSPINFLSPLQLQRAQLQERASDQGCSLHLSHWALVFLCHLMLHELLGGFLFFPVFLPFLAIVGRSLAKDFFYYIVCTIWRGEPVLAWTVGFQHPSLSSIILQGELWDGGFSFLPRERFMGFL